MFIGRMTIISVARSRRSGPIGPWNILETGVLCAWPARRRHYTFHDGAACRPEGSWTGTL